MDQKKTSYTYDLILSTFGEIGLVRCADGGRSLICRILLPEAGRPMAGRIRDVFPDAVPGRGKQDEIYMQIRDFLTGKAVDFALEDLNFKIVKGFARLVLPADGKIPRGRVMTYGSLAASLGVPGGARAVGNAQAGNPFPLVIPCHRVVRSDRTLGGFGGGAELKRRLLELEGVVFDAQGRVLTKHLFGKR